MHVDCYELGDQTVVKFVWSKGKTLTYTTLHVAMVNSCILLVY